MTSSPQYLKLIPFYVSMIKSDVSRDGTCYLLTQIFGHFLLSERTSSNTSSLVEQPNLLDAWLFTGGTPSYLPPHKRPPNGLCLYLGWETQFEWHHHQLKSSFQLVFVVWVARTTSALFILGWDKKVSYLAGREMTRLSIILLTGWEPLFISSWFHVWSRFQNICQHRCTWKHVRLAGETC